jgi:anti-anti-sigma factor
MRPQPPFGTRVEEHDGVAVLALSGELDMATAQILRDNLAPFEGNGVSTIVLDLRDLTFIDSSGLLAFLEARKRAMSNGHRLIVSGASPAAQRLFELTGTQFLLDEQVIPDGLVRFFRDWVRRTDQTVK